MRWRRPLVGEGLGELHDAALRGGVAGHGDAALEREQRGDVDDLAAVAAVDHLAARGAAEAEHARQVDGDRFVPERVAVLGRRLAPDDAGVVDDDVDAAEALDGLGDEPSGRRPSRQIRGEQFRATAAGLRRCSSAVAAAGAVLACRATSAPAPASASAIAAPRPRDAPVTRATLPSSRNKSRVGAIDSLPCLGTLGQKVFAKRREDVDQHDFLVEHGGAVRDVRRGTAARRPPTQCDRGHRR